MNQLIATWLLGGIFRDIAEGKRGARLKAIYWWLAGKKRTTSAVAGLLFAAFVTWQPQLAEKWSGTATVVLGILVTIGIADSDWKITPPPVEWAAAFQKLMSFGPVLSAAVALAVEVLPLIPNCAACPDYVTRIQLVAGFVAAITTWLAARFALPPVTMARRVTDLTPVR